MIQNWKFQRGDIFFTRFDNAIGSEQSGNRPFSRTMWSFSRTMSIGEIFTWTPTLIVAPAASTHHPTHCLLVTEFLSVPSIVQAEQRRQGAEILDTSPGRNEPGG